MFKARRAIASIAAGTQPSTTVSKAYLSTAFEQYEGSKEGLFEAKHKHEVMKTEADRDGPAKAAEREESTAGGSANCAMHTVVEGAKQAIKAVLGEDEEDGPSNKSLNEDGSDSIEDLRRRAGGYDMKNR